MKKLGSALVVVGFLMFLTPFFGIAWSMAQPSRIHEGHDAFREGMDQDRRVIAITVGIAVVGFLCLVGGKVMMGDSPARHARATDQHEPARAGERSTWTFCGAERERGPCSSCGART